MGLRKKKKKSPNRTVKIQHLNLNLKCPQNVHKSRLVAFPKQQILDSSKLKESADENFKCDENSRKLSKPVENAMGKREIARDKQFLSLSTVFSKDLYSRHVKTSACLGNG